MTDDPFDTSIDTPERMARLLVALGHPDEAIEPAIAANYPDAQDEEIANAIADARDRQAVNDEQHAAALDREALEQEHRAP